MAAYIPDYLSDYYNMSNNCGCITLVNKKITKVTQNVDFCVKCTIQLHDISTRIQAVARITDCTASQQTN